MAPEIVQREPRADRGKEEVADIGKEEPVDAGEHEVMKEVQVVPAIELEPQQEEENVEHVYATCSVSVSQGVAKRMSHSVGETPKIHRSIAIRMSS